MSRASTKRSANNPLATGCATQKVLEANTMVSRTCILQRLFEAKRCSWTLEQPSSSLMVRHPRVRYNVKVVTWMGMFGARTPKQTYLLSNKPWIEALQRTKDTSRVWDNDGVVNVKNTAAGKQVTMADPTFPVVFLVLQPRGGCAQTHLRFTLVAISPLGQNRTGLGTRVCDVPWFRGSSIATYLDCDFRPLAGTEPVWVQWFAMRCTLIAMFLDCDLPWLQLPPMGPQKQ